MERILPVLLAEVDAVVHVAVLLADALYRSVAAGASIGDRFEFDCERTPLRVLDAHRDHAVRARGEYPALVVVGPDGAFAALEVRHAAIARRIAPLRQVRRVDDKADRTHERIALERIAAFVRRLLDDFAPDFLFASGERQLARPVAVLPELEITSVHDAREKQPRVREEYLLVRKLARNHRAHRAVARQKRLLPCAALSDARPRLRRRLAHDAEPRRAELVRGSIERKTHYGNRGNAYEWIDSFHADILPNLAPAGNTQSGTNQGSHSESEKLKAGDPQE